MDITYYRFEEKNIKRIVNDIPTEQWREKTDWIDIRYTDRSEIFELLSFLPFIEGKREIVLNPEMHPLPITDNEYIVQNFIISKKDNIYKADYVTLIVMDDLIISIIALSNDLRAYESQPNHLKEQFSDMRFYFAYALGAEIFRQSIANMGSARKRLREMENILIKTPEKLSSGEVMATLSDIGRLADIVEDQYVGFEMFASYLINKDREQDKKKLKEILDSFAELNRIIVRIEEKAESFRYQFMLIHQEQSAHRINILTIIQAIFVPLTFLAGIYGMNFKNMPELEWKYAYFIVWGIFITIAFSLMLFFKKRGWFD